MDTKTISRNLFILMILATCLLPPIPANADTPTPVYPLPAGWGPAGGIEIMGGINGIPTTLHESGAPCGQYLQMLDWGYQGEPDPALSLRIDQDIPSGYIRLRAAVQPSSVELDQYQSLKFTSYASDGVTEVGSLEHFLGEFYHNDDWAYLDLMIPAYTGYGGYLEIQLSNRLLDLYSFPIGYNFAGLYATDSYNPVPDQICEVIPATPTPSRTPTNTPLPTPTGTITATWTPSPSPTLAPTMPLIATGTPTPSPQPFATWTPAPTWTTLPTGTPLPMTRLYGTPAGGWGTPRIPTLAPISTLADLPGMTPNATYEARVNSMSTAVAYGSGMQTRVYTYTNLALSWTDPTTDLTGLGSMSSILVTVTQKVAMPINFLKGLEDYMPNTWPLLLTLLVSMLWIMLVLLLKFGLAVIQVVVRIVVKLAELIGGFLPGT